MKELPLIQSAKSVKTSRKIYEIPDPDFLKPLHPNPVFTPDPIEQIAKGIVVDGTHPKSVMAIPKNEIERGLN